MFQLWFYVPESDLDKVKAAVFAAGGGVIGEYQACCFATRGQGQFMPGHKAQPYIGNVGQVSQVAEIKVELVVADNLIDTVIEALRTAHPYEEPALGAIKLDKY